MTNSSSEEAIVEKILEDAQKQAKRILDGAERTAESQRKKADSEASKIREQTLDQAKVKAEMLRAKEIATARLEAKRILLDAREGIIRKAFAAIERELARLRKANEYRETLLRLALEAIAAVGGKQVKLVVSKEDEALVDEGFMTELEQRIAGGSSRAGVEIDLEVAQNLEDGGCIATSPDGRIVFDNTLKRRFERMKPTLRAMLIERLSVKDE